MRLHVTSARPSLALALTIAVLAALSAGTGAAMDMEGMDMPAHDGTATYGHAAEARSATKTVAITMDNLKFQPDALHVKAGETIHFVITNASDTAHEFTLGDSSFQQAHRQHMAAMAGMPMHHHDTNSVSVAAHGTKELTWAFERPGQVEFDCDIPGHYEAGMKGTIVVE